MKINRYMGFGLAVLAVFSGVLIYVLVQQEGRIAANLAAEYEEVIMERENKIAELDGMLIRYQTAGKEQEAEVVEPDNQGGGDPTIAASAFLEAYFTYDSSIDSLAARRAALADLVTGEQLLNYLAPDNSGLELNVEGASGLTYGSKLTEAKIFYRAGESTDSPTEVLAAVTYLVTNNDGDAEFLAYIHLGIDREENGQFKVSSFDYYNRT